MASTRTTETNRRSKQRFLQIQNRIWRLLQIEASSKKMWPKLNSQPHKGSMTTCDRVDISRLKWPLGTVQAQSTQIKIRDFAKLFNRITGCSLYLLWTSKALNVCHVCQHILLNTSLLEIFVNPHSPSNLPTSCISFFTPGSSSSRKSASAPVWTSGP